jgi:hypothetical protein
MVNHSRLRPKCGRHEPPIVRGLLDVLTVSRALELALFRDAKLDVSKVRAK